MVMGERKAKKPKPGFGGFSDALPIMVRTGCQKGTYLLVKRYVPFFRVVVRGLSIQRNAHPRMLAETETSELASSNLACSL